MGQISVTITDFADTRAFQCKLPDNVQVSSLAARLAEMAHFPDVGPDGSPLKYGLIVKGGTLLNSYVDLANHDLPDSPVFRLVPEFIVGSGDGAGPAEVAETVIVADAITAAGGDYQTGTLPFLPQDLNLGPRPDVRIDAAVHKEIERFARRDPQIECAGLLLGTVDVEGDQTVLHISAFAPALDAIGTRATVKVTLDAWESMLTIRDRDYHDLQVLGWFHSHAGWGIFMSDADVFVHRHFFSRSAMVAFVLDSMRGRDGFFYWHEGEITLCSSYALMGARSQQADEPRPRKKKARPDARDFIIVALAGLSLYLGTAGVAPNRHHISSPPAARAAARAPQAAPVEGIRRPEHAQPDLPAVVTRGRERVYTVQEGDMLSTVCRKFYGDANLGTALAEYNKIDDTGLQIGQEIHLPRKAVLEKMM